MFTGKSWFKTNHPFRDHLILHHQGCDMTEHATLTHCIPAQGRSGYIFWNVGCWFWFIAEPWWRRGSRCLKHTNHLDTAVSPRRHWINSSWKLQHTFYALLRLINIWQTQQC
jgi:hypothetical protein